MGYVRLQSDYKGKRRDEYPPKDDQLDAIWKYIDTMITPAKERTVDQAAKDIRQKIHQVKNKYPKRSK